MSNSFKVHFTLSEAREALPDLRRRLIRIGDLLAEIRSDEARSGPVETVILRGNGLGPIITGASRWREEAQRLIQEIAIEGIQIKDLERGLVDFPHILDTDPPREVFLCWLLGEDTVEFWHEIEAGFAGRKPLRTN